LRRERVLQLTSQGLNQQEIADKLNWSQATVSNDINYLKRASVDKLRQHIGHLAFQYDQVRANLELLRREGWALFEKTQDERIKAMLINTLMGVNETILQVQAAGDMINQEMLAETQDIIEETREELEHMEEHAIGGEQQQEPDDSSTTTTTTLD
jgi:transcriptional regulator